MENAPEYIIDKVGKKIVKLRKDKGLKQIDLAILSDVDERVLRRIESGNGNPTVKTLEKIANALSVELSDFFK